VLGKKHTSAKISKPHFLSEFFCRFWRNHPKLA
jgi:hypothetical protein